MIVPTRNPDNGESNIIWTGQREDLDGVCDFVFGDEAPVAFPFNSATGEIILDAGHVRRGDMIHRDAAGAIRVLRPVGPRAAENKAVRP